MQISIVSIPVYKWHFFRLYTSSHEEIACRSLKSNAFERAIHTFRKIQIFFGRHLHKSDFSQMSSYFENPFSAILPHHQGIRKG